jgi:RNA-directed DNA polymerase
VFAGRWRIVGYADDFVILVHGTRDDTETLREDIARVLAPLGLRPSEAKTRVAHMSEGLDFLGSASSGAASEARASGTSIPSSAVGPSGRCRTRSVCKHTLGALENLAWQRVISWWMHLCRWRWKDVRRHLTGPHGRWRRPTADGIELFNIAKVPVTRHRYRGSKTSSPWAPVNHA